MKQIVQVAMQTFAHELTIRRILDSVQSRAMMDESIELTAYDARVLMGVAYFGMAAATAIITECRRRTIGETPVW